MKQHATTCASNTHKYYGDVRNESWGNEMLPCNCDGDHSFAELYEHRHTLFIALCKTAERIGRANYRCSVCKQDVSLMWYFYQMAIHESDKLNKKL